VTGANRRAFLKLACALGPLGLAARALAAGRSEAFRRPAGAGLDESYVRLALAQLSRAHEEGWTSGHHGAALLACHYFLVENDVDERTAAALRAQVERFVAFRADAFRLGDVGSGRARVRPIVEQLDAHVAELRSGGHDAIYAALALRALRDHEDLATRDVIHGIARTLKAFVGSQRPWRPTPFQEQNPMAPYEGADDLAAVTLRAMLRPWSAVLDLGSGNVVHWVTHADALITLEELGWQDVSRKGYTAHQLYVNRPVWDDGRSAGDVEPIDWLSADYWESDAPRRLQNGSWFFGHAFKFPYSLLRLLRRVDDPELERACLERATLLLKSFE